MHILMAFRSRINLELCYVHQYSLSDIQMHQYSIQFFNSLILISLLHSTHSSSWWTVGEPFPGWVIVVVQCLPYSTLPHTIKDGLGWLVSNDE